ncbi:hypothetical protein [Paenarthrobacter sp. TA1.8]|uniref:hypothetical protein n=2 Tax=Micrococcales TaxID=85006 RepID=UPI003B438533
MASLSESHSESNGSGETRAGTPVREGLDHSRRPRIEVTSIESPPAHARPRSTNPMALDHAFLRTPQDFSSMLIEMQEGSWPPDEADIIRIAQGCSMLIECIDAWESATHGKNVFDVARGEICTADVRRLLAQEVSLSYEGDVAVLLVPPADERVRVEIRADVDEYQGLLRRPEMVLDWEQDGKQHEHYISLKPKGAHWYMLSQLRDDMKEGRLTVRS